MGLDVRVGLGSGSAGLTKLLTPQTPIPETATTEKAKAAIFPGVHQL